MSAIRDSYMLDPASTFTDHRDPDTGKRWITVDRWAKRMLIGKTYFKDDPTEWVSHPGPDLVRFSVSNGWGTYRAIDDFEYEKGCVLVDCEWRPTLSRFSG